MLFLIIMIVSFGTVECAIPGTFFWKPRLALIMMVPTTEPPNATEPTKDNIRDGYVVIIDGFRMAMCVSAVAEDLLAIKEFPQYDPSSAYFYTTAYRWALRYLSLLPDWLSGKSGHYTQTHRVWRRRFHYLDVFVPKWIRPLLPFVKKSEWEKEEKEYKGYTKYAQKYFRHIYMFPGKNYTTFTSQQFDFSGSDDTSSMSCINSSSSTLEEHAEASSHGDSPCTSPLPELTIEKTSKRRDDDDESAEFYAHFTKKILRYYRKYFLKEEVSNEESLVNFDKNREPQINITDEIGQLKASFTPIEAVESEQNGSKYPGREKEDETQINTFHEGTNKEGDSIHHEMDRSLSPETEAWLNVHTWPPRLTIERRASSSNTGITNSDNVEKPSETSFNIDNLPRSCAMERISVNEIEKSRPRLKRTYSCPENSTKRLKRAKAYKTEAAPTVLWNFPVNEHTQTEEICNRNVATQTDRQVRSVQIQTEVDMIDSETQTDNVLEININV